MFEEIAKALKSVGERAEDGSNALTNASSASSYEEAAERIEESLPLGPLRDIRPMYSSPEEAEEASVAPTKDDLEATIDQMIGWISEEI